MYLGTGTCKHRRRRARPRRHRACLMAHSTAGQMVTSDSVHAAAAAP